MFDDLPRPRNNEFPRNLEALSIEELEHYIHDLQEEISRAQADIVKKRVSRDAAASVFK